MGTRSTTKIFSEAGEVLVNMYRQYDGYLEGHGVDLAEFLQSKTIVNGVCSETVESHANGMGCLAAQMIAHFKTDIGKVYLDRIDCEEEFNYEVRLIEGKVAQQFHIKVIAYDEVVFEGSPEELLKKSVDTENVEI